MNTTLLLPIILFILATTLLLTLYYYQDHKYFTDPDYPSTLLHWLAPENRLRLLTTIAITLYLLVLVFIVSADTTATQKAKMYRAQMGTSLKGSREFSRLQSDEELEMIETLQKRGESAGRKRGKKWAGPPKSPVTRKEYPKEELAFKRIDIEGECAKIFEKIRNREKLNVVEKELWGDVCESL